MEGEIKNAERTALDQDYLLAAATGISPVLPVCR
jgi:hypothetical protein